MEKLTATGRHGIDPKASWIDDDQIKERRKSVTDWLVYNIG